MKMGMIGLGRMGANMGRRLMAGGHQIVGFDPDVSARQQAAADGIEAVASLDALADALSPVRVVWMMVPAGEITGTTVDALQPLLQQGDILVDGGNSFYKDTLQRAQQLADHGIEYVDAGTSGGVWGLDEGYSLMVGGSKAALQHLRPILETLAPAVDRGWGHVGPVGSGHFTKMVHNGIEYGLMAAYAEGLNILHKANIGKARHEADAETTPLRHPEHYQYDLNLADITELWRRGSVIASWLLDLTAASFVKSPRLDGFAGKVSDSGEGRWTLAAAIDEAVPAHVLTAALLERFASRGEDDFQNRVLSAMRFGFGGHVEKK